MRQETHKQLPLAESTPDHPKAAELAVISQILDRKPIIYERALQDLTNGIKNPGKGAKGLDVVTPTCRAISAMLNPNSSKLRFAITALRGAR